MRYAVPVMLAALMLAAARSSPAQVRSSPVVDSVAVQVELAALGHHRSRMSRGRAVNGLFDPRIRGPQGWLAVRLHADTLAALLGARVATPDEYLRCPEGALDWARCEMAGSSRTLALGAAAVNGDRATIAIHGWERGNRGVARSIVIWELKRVQGRWIVVDGVASVAH